MNSFGQRLKALRKEAGVSQSFVADHIGVSTQSVSNWECDNTMPDISQIVPLAALLSVSTDCCSVSEQMSMRTRESSKTKSKKSGQLIP